MIRRAVAAAALASALAGCAREQAPAPAAVVDVDATLERAAVARAAGTAPGRALADSLYRSVLAADPDQSEARYGLATVTADAGRSWAAQWHLLRLLHVRPEHAGALSTLGLSAYTQGRLEDAVSYLERLSARRALGFEESVALADACNRRNRFAKAESIFVAVRERFPDADPGSASLISEGLGHARWKQGRLDEAADDLAAAVESPSATVTTRLTRAMVLADLGRAQEARTALPELTFEEARQAGVLADYFVLKNRLLLLEGDDRAIEAGARELERVAKEAPDQVSVPHLLVQMWRRVGNLDAARAAARLHAETIRSVDRRDDARAENQLLRGAALEGEGDLAGALEAYDQGLDVAPDNANLLCAAGSVLAALDRRDEAREMFARLRAAGGGDSPGTLLLAAGAELRRRGLPRAAARRFELAAARLPGNHEPVYLQALALAEAGDWDAAVRVGAPLERSAPPPPP